MELTQAQTGFLERSLEDFRLSDWTVELAGQAASARRFFRVSRVRDSKTESYILVEWDSGDEDWPRFLDIGTQISSHVPFLPKIYANDPAHGFILEEDLGATTLKRFCVDNSVHISNIEHMYKEVIDAMVTWQRLDVGVCPVIASRAMDREIFLWESDYFAKHCVAGFFTKSASLTRYWEEERMKMAERAAALDRTFIHRDFQSENILIHNGKIRFVDYQGARLGPPHYDAASLLYDPYVNQFDDITVKRLLEYYFNKKNNVSSADDFYICAAQRLMQALGAYGNLSLNKGKPHYSQFIPAALQRLSDVFERLPQYPAMGETVCSLQCTVCK